MTQLLFQDSPGGHILRDDLEDVAAILRTRYTPAAGAHTDGLSIIALPSELHGIEVVCPCQLGAEAARLPLRIQIARYGQRQNLRLRLVAEHFHERRIRAQEPVLLHADRADPIWRVFDKRAQFRFLSTDSRLRLLAPRHVDSNARKIGFAFEIDLYA